MSPRTFLVAAATFYGGFLLDVRPRGTSRAPKLKIRTIPVYLGPRLTGAAEALDSLAGRGVEIAGLCDRRSRQPLQCGWRPKGAK